jgi:response regulator RpfG family c-di-GMP phosphodiesterase
MLPILTTEATVSEIADPSGSGTARPAADALRGIRVLIVDDEEDARELAGAVLRQRGALVTLAADVATALVAFDASPPDVVVSDIAMPGGDGYAMRSLAPSVRVPTPLPLSSP